jgi:hypothetical protein
LALWSCFSTYSSTWQLCIGICAFERTLFMN